MMNSNCEKGGRPAKLCPLSLGLAAGIVSFFSVLIWTVWVMTYGMPPLMVAMQMPMPTLSEGFVHALLALVKGFLYGFFIALFYDLIFCGFSCLRSGRKCEDLPENKK